ncbi:hypothetical protein IscW_ISCW017924 [Ixodes scapularis]|uniref:Uncharacterized protein n=1 Tax=Ixodes scapularis TaxID=6945 RepID=B7PHZ9_IXOSC|nr:hypothetical protein IscW_ISCW017924 [Ixodes scapularis]|eukprot:XP_002404010.1 hypothetical protein IscW_ISCW017924 [Ixodes scapularis]
MDDDDVEASDREIGRTTPEDAETDRHRCRDKRPKRSMAAPRVADAQVRCCTSDHALPPPCVGPQVRRTCTSLPPR